MNSSDVALSILQAYARLPYHPGKWRVTEAFAAGARLDRALKGRAFVSEFEGIRWRLSNECSVQRRLLYHGLLDLHDCRALMGSVSPGGVFLDVGSYFGYYGLTAARRGAVAFAFEPSIDNYRLLKQQCGLNPELKVKAVPFAVGERSGVVRFGNSDASNRGRGAIVLEGCTGESVEMVSLDEFVESEGIQQVQAMKIDVEGAEMHVLRGAARVLSEHRPTFLIEVNRPCLARFGASVDELSRLIRSFEYELWRVTRRGRVPFRGLEAEEDYCNVLCTPLGPRAGDGGVRE